MGVITAIDHIVLKSPDVEHSLEFYCGVLGLEALRVDEWRNGKIRFPSIRVNGDTIIDIFPTDDPAGKPEGQHLDHYCLLVEANALDGLLEKVAAFGIEPGSKQFRWGARGRGESSYLNGPEGVTIELRHYPDDGNDQL